MYYDNINLSYLFTVTPRHVYIPTNFSM